MADPGFLDNRARSGYTSPRDPAARLRDIAASLDITERLAEGDADMPSQAMQDVIEALRDRRKASASQPPPTLEERRAAFTPGDRLHPVPDDVLVTEVTAGGVPAHWLTAPGADPGRVLLFLHGGGYELGSVRSDGELAARLGRASGMRVLFPNTGWPPSIPSPPPSTTSWPRGAGSAPARA